MKSSEGASIVAPADQFAAGVAVVVHSVAEGRLTITVPEAGALLGLRRSASYNAARSGAIPTLRLNSSRLVVPIVPLLQQLGICVPLASLLVREATVSTLVAVPQSGPLDEVVDSRSELALNVFATTEGGERDGA